MPFEFATANRIVFGSGRLGEIGALARSFGRRALVVTGGTASRADRLVKLLGEAGVAAGIFRVQGEPTTRAVVDGVEAAREQGCELVIGFGGGSPIDAAKAVSAMLRNDGELLDFLEVIGQARPLRMPAAPCIAVPTTAGAGAEVTRNAVLASPEHRVKVSMRSPWMIPRVALVDPELTRDLPPGLTASTGLDALTQLIEPYVCLRPNPMTDALALEGMRRAARSLRRAVEQGNDMAAREDMAVASLFGGLALANAGLGAVHGFAAPIGGMYPAPHGAVCAALLPEVMDANLRALRREPQQHGGLERYARVARVLTDDPTAAAEDGARWVAELREKLEIPRLRVYGLDEAQLGDVVDKAARASSMKANPVVFSQAELLEILRRAL